MEYQKYLQNTKVLCIAFLVAITVVSTLVGSLFDTVQLIQAQEDEYGDGQGIGDGSEESGLPGKGMGDGSNAYCRYPYHWSNYYHGCVR